MLPFWLDAHRRTYDTQGQLCLFVLPEASDRSSSSFSKALGLFWDLLSWWTCGYLLRVLSGEELEVGHGGVLVSPQGVGGAAQEQRGQQLCVDAAFLVHHAHHHLDTQQP